MYATVQSMTARFGEYEMIALSDRAKTGHIDAAVVQDAIDDAASEIDTYLAGRYLLPLSPAPKVLNGVCCDIARYRLCGGETRDTEEIRTRYKYATNFLQRVASGDITLGTTPTGATQEPDQSVQFSTGTRVFGRENR